VKDLAPAFGDDPGFVALRDELAPSASS